MEQLVQLFDAIDARVPPRDWDGLAGDFQAVLNCNFATCYLLGVDAADRHEAKVVLTTHPGAVEEYIEKGINRIQILDEREAPGFTPFRLSDYISDAAFRHHPFYTRWGKKYGHFHVVLCVLVISPGELLILSVGRPDGEPDFTQEECVTIGLAARYLRRYVQLIWAVESTNSIDVVERFRIPAAVVEANVLVVANDHFRTWCATSGAVVIGAPDGRIRFADDDLEQRIWDSIRTLRAAQIDPAAPPRTQVNFNIGMAPTGQFILQMMPLQTVGSAPMQWMWFIHPASSNEAVTNLGVEVGLTTSEIEVFALLAQGQSARSIAELTDRAPATVRWHIRNILSKCGASSQRELLYRLFNEVEAI